MLPQGSLWTSLPPVIVDKEQIEDLFKVQTKVQTSKPKDRLSKPKELLILDPKRSNQINIGIRSLPPVSQLKEMIERMDDTCISRAGVEKLQSLMPVEGEVAQLQAAAREGSEGLPFGTAEQFLLMMASIPGLECRLKLWAFKVDFKAMEKDICEPLMALRTGMSAVQGSQTFARLMALVLAVGNTLNRTTVKGFQPDYLTELSSVKDTVTRNSLLHHLTGLLWDKQPDMADLGEQFSSLGLVARTDYELLEGNLTNMEEECKTSLGYLTLSACYTPDTRTLVSSFLTDAAERILSMQRVSELVKAEYGRFLCWLGLASHLHRDFPQARVAKILLETAVEVARAKERLARERAKEARSKTVSPSKVPFTRQDSREEVPDSDSPVPVKAGGRRRREKGQDDGLEAYLAEASVKAVHQRGRRRSGGKVRTAVSTM